MSLPTRYMRCALVAIVCMHLSPSHAAARFPLSAPIPLIVVLPHMRCAKCQAESSFIKQQVFTFITSAAAIVLCGDKPEVKKEAMQACAASLVNLFAHGWNS